MNKTLQKILVAALIVGVVVAVVAVLIWLSPFLLLKTVMASAYQQLVVASVPRRLALGVLLFAGTPFILAVLRLFSVRAPFLDEMWPPKKLHAFSLVFLYVGGFSTFMYFVTRNQHFMPGETHYVCTVDYKFFEGGAICPVHGKPLQPVTPEIIEIVEGVRKHGPPHEIALGPEGPFVDPATGQPAVWFGEQDGALIAYSGPGFDPVSAARLIPATPDMIVRFRASGIAKQKEQKRDAAEEVERQRAVARNRELLAEAQKLAKQLERDPDNSDLAFRTGEAFRRAGDSGRAREYYRKALWVDPTMDEAKRALRALE